jgi:hypothetical protein
MEFEDRVAIEIHHRSVAVWYWQLVIAGVCASLVIDLRSVGRAVFADMWWVIYNIALGAENALIPWQDRSTAGLSVGSSSMQIPDTLD